MSGSPGDGAGCGGKTDHTRKAGASRRFRTLTAVLPPAVIIVVLLATWQGAVTAGGVKPTVLPSPQRILEQGWIAREAIWSNTLPTLQETFLGFAVSLTVAWILAIVIDFSPWLRRALMPLLVASQTIPIIAIAPLMVIWFGFGIMPKVMVIALVTFFPVTVGLIDGFNLTDRDAGNLLRSMGAKRWKQFVFVRLPSVLPSFFTALRIGIAYAVTGAIFAEYIGARNGLGIYMATMKDSFRTDLVLAAVAVTAFLSVFLFLLTYAAERLIIPWHSKERRNRHV